MAKNRKTSARKRQLSSAPESLSPVRNISSTTRTTDWPPRGLVMLIRAVIVVGIIVFVFFLWKPFKPSPKVLPPPALTEIAQNFIDSNAPFVGQKFECSFDGIKATRGYTGWGEHPMEGKGIMGGELNINGKTYKHGIGTQAPSVIVFDLSGRVKRFSCLAGADGGGGDSDQIFFAVKADNKKLFQSPVLKIHNDPVTIDVDVTGAKELKLIVASYGDDSWKQAIWANLKFTKISKPSEDESRETATSKEKSKDKSKKAKTEKKKKR